ncbi:MAG: neutral/alkaline non-lysosomal ceramidase N-terminal domain-containing protein [Gemmatales bacterium]|nr:neutral/alkaline non-lysosomal ceramidase N-terminal domain-containing protein [Gemmatales bacterium]MDW8385755.1 neutral/alkaline non-lysosomal ceramidase N-terminal domain-containing protein [Gemmatales bacterium]
MTASNLRLLCHRAVAIAAWMLAATCFLGTASPTIAASETRANDEATLYPVGLSRTDVTPNYPVRLSGFGFRRTESEGVTQRIWVKALAIGSDDDGPLVVLAVDNLFVPLWMTEELAQRLAKKARIHRDRLAVTATHTHTAPVLKGTVPTLFGMPLPADQQERVDRYSAELLDKMEQTALAALADRRPAKLTWGIGRVSFAVNRRTQGGPVDHDLPVMVIRSPDHAIRGIWVNYACHCVTLSNNKISGDWAGYAQEAIEDDHPGAIALVSIGCGADANPSSGVTGDKVEIAARQGREIADEVKRLVGGFLTPLSGQLRAARKVFELPLDEPPSKAELEERAKRQDHTGYHARYQLDKLNRGEALPKTIPYSVQVWAFGDKLACVFLPGEVVVDYALRLKKELDGTRLWINAYSNDCPCYIPSERILREGGYEGGGAMIYYGLPTRLKPGLEQPILDAVKELTGPGFLPRFDGNKTQGTRPLPPQQSALTLTTPRQLHVELVASEPLVQSPVAIDWGPDGRLYVAEMLDYPEGLDGAYRPGGRIRVLHDLDGDGRYDRADVFADGIPFPTGVLAYRDGVLVCAAPDILYLADTDNDGRAEVRLKLYSGFGTENYQARVNSLEYGLDGWIYGSCGMFGGTIACTSLDGKHRRTVALGDRDFRIRPETGELEPASGRTQQGRVRDDWGHWFGCDNSTLLVHYPLDEHYLRRNPHVKTRSHRVYVPGYQNSHRLFPAIGHQQLFALSGPPRTVTAACGLGIYRDDLLGPQYRGNAFICEPVNHLVHREVMSPRGSTFTSRRAEEESQSEFLTSTDPWFRPVQVRTGPDGALWIVDMYRFLIEHPRWIPPADLEKLDARAGSTFGRIYRIVPREGKPRPVPKLDRMSAPQLVEALDTPNGWQRDMVTHRLLLLPKESLRSLQPPLQRLAIEAQRPETRLAALCVLDQARLLGAEVVQRSLTDADARVRRHAVRLAPLYLRSAEELRTLWNLVDELDPHVRLELACALGGVSEPRAAEVLVALIRPGTDAIFADAWLSSLNKDNCVPILRSLTTRLRSGEMLPMRSILIGTTATLLRTQSQEAVTPLLAEALRPDKETAAFAGWQWDVLAGVLDVTASHVEKQPWKPGDDLHSLVQKMLRHAHERVADPACAEYEKVRFLQYLGHDEAHREEDLKLLASLLSPDQSPAVQQTALRVMSRIPDDRIAGIVLADWPNRTPGTKAACLDLLLSRPKWVKELIAALVSGKVSVNDLDATRRQILLDHPDAEVRSTAARIFSGPSSADRAKVLAEYRPAAATLGNAVEGKRLFAKHCSGCHRLENVGHSVGPDLAAVASKPPEYLLQEILDPNRNVDTRYTINRILLKDGRIVSGLLASENAATLTLRAQEGREEVVLRSEIEQLQGTGRSLMPEGFEKELSPRAMSDLLAYLASAVPSPEAVSDSSPKPPSKPHENVLKAKPSAADNGTEPNRQEPGAGKKVDPKSVAAQLLDDSLPSAVRQGLAARHADQAAEIIAAMTADLGADAKEEYRRIPWIWRVAVNAGRKNEDGVLIRLFEVALPEKNGKLRDWQAVVLGGGIVHGLSLEGLWPKTRIAELLKNRPDLAARWQQALDQASSMADDEKVPTGTRYDALRMIAMETWERRGKQLLKYLQKGIHEEVQSGAVSGLADMQTPEVAEPLAQAISYLPPDNRRLALDALIRSTDRVKVLLDYLENGKIEKSWLSNEQIRKLKRVEDAALKQRVERLFGS